MSYFRTCPRCNERGYEVLHTHAYCVNCNYSPDLLYRKRMSADDLPIPPWAAKAVAECGQSSDQAQASKVIQLKPTKAKSEDFEGGAA
jgi:hypothetical protein